MRLEDGENLLDIQVTAMVQSDTKLQGLNMTYMYFFMILSIFLAVSSASFTEFSVLMSNSTISNKQLGLLCMPLYWICAMVAMSMRSCWVLALHPRARRRTCPRSWSSGTVPADQEVWRKTVWWVVPGTATRA
jgi:hypothetical protein